MPQDPSVPRRLDLSCPCTRGAPRDTIRGSEKMGPVAYFSLCLLGCLVFNPALADQAQDASCPVGWIHLHNNCYGYFSQERTWMDAEAECQRHWHGAHLASIHSAGENNILAHYVQRYHKKKSLVWIGLWDPDQNLNWRWADESLVNFIAWDKWQPNNPRKKEYCVVLDDYRGFQKWHDYPCNYKYSFVCKNKAKGRKLVHTRELPTPGL